MSLQLTWLTKFWKREGSVPKYNEVKCKSRSRVPRARVPSEARVMARPSDSSWHTAL